MFCGVDARELHVVVSSAYEREGWHRMNLFDEELASRPGVLGFSSGVGHPEDHPEWIELQLPAPRTIAGVTLYPAANDGEGFPYAITVEVWNGARWTTVAERGDLPAGLAPQAITWPAITTTRVRITGAHLRAVRGDHVMQFAEVTLTSPP